MGLGTPSVAASPRYAATATMRSAIARYFSATDGHDSVLRVAARRLAHPLSRLVALDDGADRRRHRRGVSVLGDEPGSAAEQLDGVREAGCDHGDARGHRLDEHARRGLIARLVRQQDDVRGADELRRAAPRRGSDRRA